MLAKLTRTIPDGDGWLFEPKWDGFRCIVFRDGDEIELASRNERPFTRYFPELLDPLRAALPARCVVDGEIVVADRDGRGLDFDALLQRIHPAESRVRRLAAETPASYIAFDLLALDDDVLLERPLGRAPRASCSRRSDPVDRSTSRRPAPIARRRPTGSGGSRAPASTASSPSASTTPTSPTSGRWSRSSTSARRSASSPGTASTRTATASARCCSACTTTQDQLQHVGVAAAFSVKFRAELLAELEPLTHEAVDDHPWGDWAEWQHTDAARKPGATSRWNAGKDLSWVPDPQSSGWPR